MGLKEWEAALADIDTAIATHREGFSHAKEHPCSSMIEMQGDRATILEKLGRPAEAKAARDYAATEAREYPMTPYELFHARLRALRHNQNQETEKK